jgi:hypothetical protein
MAADLLSAKGMTAHHNPLLRREMAPLEQDGIGDSDFAYIMQETAPVQSHQAGSIEVPRHSQSHAHESQPLAVARGMRVALFDRLGNGNENRFGFTERVGIVNSARDRFFGRSDESFRH